MANHKSSLKRQKQSELRRARNRANKSRMTKMIKAVNEAITGKKGLDEVQELLRAAIPVIARTAVKGSIHKRNASRKVSRLTKRVNAFANTAAHA